MERLFQSQIQTELGGNLLRFNPLGDGALQLQNLERKAVILGLQQKRIQATDMLNAFQSDSRNAQVVRKTHHITHQAHLTQVRHKAGAGLIIGVGNLVASLPAFASQFTATRDRKSVV